MQSLSTADAAEYIRCKYFLDEWGGADTAFCHCKYAHDEISDST